MNIKMGFEAEIIITNRGDGYGMPKKYLNHEDYPEATPHSVRKVIADELGSLLGCKVNAPRKSKGVQTKWAVLPEWDVEFQDFQDAIGAVEIISPPLDLEDALEALRKIFSYVDENDGFACNTCGLHINLSLPNWELAGTDINALKFNTAMLVNEAKVLKRYDRGASVYTTTHYDYMVVLAVSRLLIEPSFDSWKDLGCFIQSGKQFAINYKKLERENPYIEFRHIGGEDYIYKYKTIEKDIRHLCASLISASKNSHFNTDKPYQKRISEFVSDVNGTISLMKELNPTVKAVTETYGGSDSAMTFSKFLINTNAGVIAETTDCGMQPTVYLNLDINEASKYSDLVSSHVGTAEMLPIRACYLALKYRRAKGVQ